MGETVADKDISILFATYKRSESVKRVLESFVGLRTGSLSWEVLVADNAGDVDTKNVVESFRNKLDVRYFVQKKRGKNKALNLLLPEAKGEIFVFTDDDIVADNNWLTEIWEGVNRWPKYSIFGGRVLTYNPEIIPETFKRMWCYPYLYAIADWNIPEGVYPSKRVFGPNMIVRSQLFSRGYRFCESVGPSHGNYITGSETEFLLRMYGEGYKAVYLPNALVYHYIRDDQINFQWVLKRGFREGRQIAYSWDDRKAPRIFGMPRHLFREYKARIVQRVRAYLSRDRLRIMTNAYEFQLLHGQFYQHWKSRKNRGTMNDEFDHSGKL